MANEAHKPIRSAGAPAPVGPYSQAIAAGDFVYTAGQIALDPVSGTLVAGGVEAQTERVMANLKAVLEAAGLGFGDVVKTTIYLKSMDDFTLVNSVYGKHFGDSPPARSTVEVSRLPKNAAVEIDLVAYRARGR